MAGHSVTHSEDWWELLSPPTAVRCEGHYKTGLPCRREAVLGSTVCKNHGGAAPQVRAAAAARIGNAADEMVKGLLTMFTDPDTDARDKIKIAQDMLDRADLGGVQKHIVGVGELDPVESLFRNVLADPAALAAPAPAVRDDTFAQYNRVALEAYGGDDVVEAEVVEVEAPNETMSSRPPEHIRLAMERLI
ncbi:hypothetical protein [Nocardioides sp. Leaf307]|uniref:hypothetical protein n=1 Tax=Nocardioides sp. Leaf307 TaxID=1736331 RepID=UPI00070339DD|nr:hypothetical protein [Nocardioides sp. Leaf307]KQQ43080.1 hypothetical protein ASF50_03540 [Nocardioides sp. Leaf307]